MNIHYAYTYICTYIYIHIYIYGAHAHISVPASMHAQIYEQYIPKILTRTSALTYMLTKAHAERLAAILYANRLILTSDFSY